MGWSIFTYYFRPLLGYSSTENYGGEVTTTKMWGKDESKALADLEWSPSTDIVAAEQVLEVLKKRYDRVFITVQEDTEAEAIVEIEDHHTYNKKAEYYEEEAMTLSEAICKVALEAHEQVQKRKALWKVDSKKGK